jgi:hypothetical protein
MKPRINYRAERAERVRKKAAKKEARLAALTRKPQDTEAGPSETPDDGGSMPIVHRYGD